MPGSSDTGKRQSVAKRKNIQSAVPASSRGRLVEPLFSEEACSFTSSHAFSPTLPKAPQRVFPSFPRRIDRKLDQVIRPFCWCVEAVVPDLDGPRPIFTGRNLTLECTERNVVIFDLHRQPADAVFNRNSFRNRPALEHTIFLEPHVEMVTAGIVLLDNEAERFGHYGEVFFRSGLRFSLSPAARTAARKLCLSGPRPMVDSLKPSLRSFALNFSIARRPGIVESRQYPRHVEFRRTAEFVGPVVNPLRHWDAMICSLRTRRQNPFRAASVMILLILKKRPARRRRIF